MHDLAGFLVELGLVLLLLGLLGTAARRVGLPSVPLFLLAGLLLGAVPTVAAETRPFVGTTGEIGVLLLLLLLGLEFSAAEFSASLRHHAPSGAVDLVLNATPGLVAGLLLGLGWRGAVAMAGVTWVSSSGIVARLLSDLGRTGNRETPAVLSLLVLEDIAMAVYLPVLAVLLAGGTVAAGGLGVGLALVALGAALLAARHLGEPLGRLLDHEDDEQVLFRVLGLTLLVAGCAEAVDASAPVGAFLVGLAVPTSAAQRVRRVLGPLRDLFAALFFLAFGLAVPAGDLLPALPAALALAVVTTGTKIVTGQVAARRDGVGPAGRRRAGLALVARGEFSIVVAGLAVAEGVTGIDALAGAYVLITGVVGPVLARYGAREPGATVP